PRGEDVYDCEARYEIGRTEFVCPADLDEDVTARVQQLALDVHRVLGCRGLSRVDLMLDGDGQAWVLEANTVPGMTETSLLPQAADAAGVDFDELVARILADIQPSSPSEATSSGVTSSRNSLKRCTTSS